MRQDHLHLIHGEEAARTFDEIAQSQNIVLAKGGMREAKRKITKLKRFTYQACFPWPNAR
jgi:hypothetical protein